MDQNHDAYYYADLLVKRLKGEISVIEEIELNNWINESPDNKKLLELLNNEDLLAADLDYFDSIDTDHGWEKVVSRTNPPSLVNPVSAFIQKWKYAAVVFVAVSLAIVLYTINSQPSNTIASKTSHYKNDVAPGTQGAILTLANGSKINMVSVKKIKTVAGLHYDEQGFVSYVTNNNNLKRSGYNIITAPLGYTYKLILPDGSKVWLNASSSIRFPVAFSRNERHVYLTGEAYFEVTKNMHKPFRVSANDADVQVLGTHFNVKAYTDEKVLKATLLEGSIKILKGKESKLIVPGQQALIGTNSPEISVEDANLNESVAWKNEQFIFDSEGIKSVMQQLARWYNVQVEYKGEAPTFHFSGSISRKNNISQILNMLELTGGVHFEINDRTVTVAR